jgi:D-alanyl-D-alanine dipeptidase
MLRRRNGALLLAALALLLLFSGCREKQTPSYQAPKMMKKVKEIEGKKVPFTAMEQAMIDSGLVIVEDSLPRIKVDLRYADIHNFLGENVYPDIHHCFVLPATLEMLRKADSLLQDSFPDLRLLILDAARPQSVQYKMYDIVKQRGQEGYIAKPDAGSLHNFGAAVDVTLFDTTLNIEVDMGTAFDHFGPEAQPRYQTRYLQEGKLSDVQIANRNILRRTMQKAGFRMIQTEWWHFESFRKEFVRAHFKMIR